MPESTGGMLSNDQASRLDEPNALFARNESWHSRGSVAFVRPPYQPPVPPEVSPGTQPAARNVPSFGPRVVRSIWRMAPRW